MHSNHLDILLCPISGECLRLIHFNDLNKSLTQSILKKPLEMGLVNESKSFFYPIISGIYCLLPHYAVSLSGRMIPQLSFDKERVFRYYNEISYESHDEKNIYEDSGKFVDFRPITKDYFNQSLLKTKQYIHPGGKYFLDIASGPIGLEEYLSLSKGYEFRICIDISFNALVQAKCNLKEQQGIFICGDITNIPLQEGVCDAVVSHHTLYHVPKKQQQNAVEELYRVAKKGGVVAIVYDWFYHSLLMNVVLFPIQFYRITRHILGKLYVKFIDNTQLFRVNS